jgi:hypothetical protein
MNAVMHTQVLTYPALQRRLISTRRSRALFLPRTTQHVRSRRTLLVEIARAAVALAALAAWCGSLLLIAV